MEGSSPNGKIARMSAGDRAHLGGGCKGQTTGNGAQSSPGFKPLALAVSASCTLEVSILALDALFAMFDSM